MLLLFCKVVLTLVPLLLLQLLLPVSLAALALTAPVLGMWLIKSLGVPAVRNDLHL